MSSAKKYIPSPVLSLLRHGYRRFRGPSEYLRYRGTSLGEVIERFRPADLRTGIPMPPASLVAFVGGHDFKRVGEVLKQHLIGLAHLQPHHKVLDIGCGVGRVAIALTDFLSPDSEYHGLDVTRNGIRWCQKEITSRHPNFRFEWCDVYNNVYNPAGRQRAGEYVFPFADATFDLVFLTSVFTHMLRPDLEHYLSEIARVLKPGGTCLATFFLLNHESRDLMAAGSSTQAFAHELNGCRVADTDMPEAAVGYDEADVRRIYDQSGLQINDAIFYGGWCGRPSFYDYQDMVVARKL